jgi:lysophospholipase L1-like esterase
MRWAAVKETGLVIVVNILIIAALFGVMEVVSARFVEKLTAPIVSDYLLHHRWPPYEKEVCTVPLIDKPGPALRFIRMHNRQGWSADHDVETRKPAGTFRIFYVGDSFTEGFLVPQEDTVPSLVERELNKAARAKGFTYEVINAGVRGYSPTLYYILVRYVLFEYSPDLIVVNVDMTDDYDDWKYAHTVVADSEGNPRACPPGELAGRKGSGDTKEGAADPSTIWNRISLFLSKHSFTYNLAYKITHGSLLEPDRDPAVERNEAGEPLYNHWMWCQYDWDELTNKNVARTLDLLRRLAILCQKNNVKLLYTSVPHYQQYSGNIYGEGKPRWTSRPHYEIQKLSKSLGVPYLNSFEALAPSITGSPQTAYYYYEDFHFNPRGYGIWAAAHVRFLTDRRNGLLPEVFSE